MDTSLLHEWLNLPAGPWPPESRTLLGLPHQATTPEQAERSALARMELLRPHQLRHPELVTEGMNRLAQALLQFNAQPLGTTEPAAILVLDAEVVAEEPALAPKPLKRKAQRRARPRTDLQDAYRDLARFRKVRRAWDDLGGILGTPSERLVSTEVIARLLIAHNALQRHRSDQLEPHEAWKAARGPQPAAQIRLLSHEERQQLAGDWEECRRLLGAEYRSARAAVRGRRHRPELARKLRDFAITIRRNPEWWLVPLTLALILAGLLRNVKNAV